ncbi:MAG: hypothetical protein HYR64_00040 [Fimbriimonas ginsengisoli]|uniref:Type II/III secretion system secretin-like domain-containing protein n=1 Tax=Fimbriimonas ginsengisoli TaxID=1005039 RepID=A0A931LQ95_FIMGI|nr:hypothetical protein [Fimbriimonas ginsengisoli]
MAAAASAAAAAAALAVAAAAAAAAAAVVAAEAAAAAAEAAVKRRRAKRTNWRREREKRMRVVWIRVVVVGCIVGCLLMVGSPAVAQLPEELRVDVYLKDADLLTATRALTQKTGLQFLVEPSSEPFGKITLKLDQVSPEDAIKYICQAAGARFKRDENGVYIIGHNRPEPTEAKAPQAPAPEPDRVVRRIRLMKADAFDVYQQLQSRVPDPNRMFKAMNEFRNVNRLDPYGKTMPTLGNTEIVSYPVGQSSFPAPRTGLDSNAKDIVLPGESANQFETGGGSANQGGFGGTGQGGVGGAGGGQGGFGGQAGGGGQAGLQGGRGLIPASIDFLTYDPTDNSLVVRGLESDIALLQSNINLFDVAPKQVLVKVEFVTTSSSVAKSLGYDVAYQRGSVFFGTQPGTFARASDPIFLTYGFGNITMRMRALLSEGYGKVVNAPIIRTLNNQPAQMTNTVTTTVFSSTVVSTPSGNITTTNLTPLTITTGLQVNPRINGDGTVTMAMNPTIQDFGQTRRGPNGQEVPDQLAQTIQVVARVRDGETIVLGGLNRKTDTGSMARFPLLSDLPIIGQFFRSSNRDNNRSELLIFVTPTIVKDDENLGLGP